MKEDGPPFRKRRFHGGGLLGQGGDGDLDTWCDFLDEQGGGDEPGRFVARNFLLDEGVAASRCQRYHQAGGMSGHADRQAWTMAHERYLLGEVFLQPDDDGPPAKLDPAIPEEMPDTFREIDASSPFLHTADEVMLVRVEPVGSIATRADEDAAALVELGRAIVAAGSGRAPQQEPLLNDLLASWHSKLDQRPVYAGFWEDLQDLFGVRPDEDVTGWEDTLRDRLGLAHLDPGPRNETVPIFVFRYPVRHLPRILGSGGERRPMVPPTVLDMRFSEAFCPSPHGGLCGHVVNLNPQTGVMRREVLHPRPSYRATHLWRVGTVRDPVDRARLPEARALHILQLRDATGRDDYAESTDLDLLA